MLKTLREAELEDEVYSLRRELALLKGNLNYPSMYDYANVKEIQLPNITELHRVATTSFDYNYGKKSWQMEGCVIPKTQDKSRSYVYTYYLADNIKVDTHYLQQVLVAQHEKIIRNIIANNKNSS